MKINTINKLSSRKNPDKKVLLVDDDADFLEALESKFKSDGFIVEKARNGIEGLQKSHTFEPNIVILDIFMPEMDGITMLKKLRAEGWGRNVPVIFLTNLKEKEKLAEALEVGIDEFYIKAEIDLDTLLERAKKLSSFTFKQTF